MSAQRAGALALLLAATLAGCGGPSPRVVGKTHPAAGVWELCIRDDAHGGRVDCLDVPEGTWDDYRVGDRWQPWVGA